MPIAFPRSPKLIKGALIELSEPFLGPVPNIIVFQYNPESFTRTMTPWSPPTGASEAAEAKDAQPFDPGESFTLSLIFDATDALEEPEKHPVAVISGVADRIAALEMLLYPTGESLLGESFAKIMGKTYAPRGKVPVVLFVWGPGRILPVRLTTFQVTEEAFSPTLYPIRATVSVGLQVLTADAIKANSKGPDGKPKLSASEELAVKAYEFTRGQKEVLARANLANAVEAGIESIISEVM